MSTRRSHSRSHLVHRCTPHTHLKRKRAPEAAREECERTRATHSHHYPGPRATTSQPSAQFVKRDPASASQVPLHPDADINSVDVRRGCPMAREIFYQRIVDQAQGNPHIKCVASCVTCGEPTGNYCDPCVNVGRTYVIPTGQILAGSPVCRQCEASFHCYVCVGVVPPGPIGQPTAPIVNIAVPPAQQ